MRNINKVYLNTLFESQIFILLFKLHYYLATVAYVLQLLYNRTSMFSPFWSETTFVYATYKQQPAFSNRLY